jgi:phage terminase large subunit
MHTAIWFVQFIGEWIHVIDFYYNNEGLDFADYAKVLQVKPYLYGEHFIGPDIVRSNAKKNGKVMIDYAADCGVHLRPVEPHSPTTRIQATRMVLNKCKWDRSRCRQGVEAMTNFHKEKNELASTEDIVVYKEIPFKDWTCHPADAFGHGAIAWRTENIGGTVMGRRATMIVNREEIDAPSDERMRV